jgi:nucleoside-diphosphate-sugar epimerase
MHPLRAQSPYSASKIGADKIAESFYRSFELPLVILRPFNTYGPRQSPRAIIPTIIVQALTSTEIYLGNLDTSRDFTFVSDTVDGFLRVASVDSVFGHEINLGNENTIRVGDLAEKILALMGKRPKILTDPRRLRPEKSEVMKLWASSQKAKEMVGWQPRVSFDVGLRDTIEWIAAHLDLYQPDQYGI